MLDINAILVYKFWYDYIKPKYQDKAKLCYIDNGSFIIHIKTKDFYKDITEEVENGLIHLTMTKMIKGHSQ